MTEDKRIHCIYLRAIESMVLRQWPVLIQRCLYKVFPLIFYNNVSKQRYLKLLLESEKTVGLILHMVEYHIT